MLSTILRSIVALDHPTIHFEKRTPKKVKTSKKRHDETARKRSLWGSENGRSCELGKEVTLLVPDRGESVKARKKVRKRQVEKRQKVEKTSIGLLDWLPLVLLGRHKRGKLHTGTLTRK